MTLLKIWSFWSLSWRGANHSSRKTLLTNCWNRRKCTESTLNSAYWWVKWKAHCLITASSIGYLPPSHWVITVFDRNYNIRFAATEQCKHSNFRTHNIYYEHVYFNIKHLICPNGQLNWPTQLATPTQGAWYVQLWTFIASSSLILLMILTQISLTFGKSGWSTQISFRILMTLFLTLTPESCREQKKDIFISHWICWCNVHWL